MNIDDIIENAQLKGKVISLEAEVKCLEAVIRAHQRVDCVQVKDLTAENARLKAEVERLTKAGDLMCRMAGNNQVINRHWKTAKGVQS